MISRSGAVRAPFAGLLLAITLLPTAIASGELLSGPSPVRIWKSAAAMEKGQDLLAASAGPDAAALEPLLACEVVAGTRATISRAERSYAWEAEVTEGPQRGCRGVVGPRDFKTEAELARRPPAEARPAAPATPAPATPTERSNERMKLWYQFSVFVDNGPTRTSWQPVAAWENSSQCDGARRRLMEADEQEVNAILDRFEVLSSAARGRLSMTHVPHEYGLDLEMHRLTREGDRTVHIEVRSYCVPADQNPQR